VNPRAEYTLALQSVALTFIFRPNLLEQNGGVLSVLRVSSLLIVDRMHRKQFN
jgi:hypothetical protein